MMQPVFEACSHQELVLSQFKPLSFWTQICPAFAKGVEPDQLASALFVIQCVNLFQQFGSSNLIGWKLEMGVAS